MKPNSMLTPPPVPDGLTPEEQRQFLEQHGQAHNLQHKTAGAYLYGSAATMVSDNLSPQAFDLHVKEMLERAGATDCPIEQMLIEQIVLAHHNIGRYYLKAANADHLELADVYHTAAARLLAEFRRCVLALRTYREPITPKSVTYVKQQNVADEQRVAFVNGQPVEAISNTDSQQGQKELAYEPTVQFVAESQARREREREPVPTNARGSGAAASGRVGEQTVAEIDRAQDA